METIVALLIAGTVLLLVETFLPGMIAGMAGGGCILAAVIRAYWVLPIHQAHTVLLVVLAGTVVGTIAWFYYFPRSPMGRALAGKGTVGNLGVERPELVNREGQALTSLRPSGLALIEGERVDVVTEGSFVEKGRPVRVVATEGMRVVVNEVKQA